MNDTMPRYFAPQRKFGGGWICFKDSPSPPPAPDYRGAAEQTAAGNLELERARTRANRYTEITPLGTRSWDKGGDQGQDPDQWTSTITLSPLVQEMVASQQRTGSKLGTIGEGMMDRVSAGYGRPFDTSRLPAAPEVSDASRSRIVDALMGRMEPQFQRQEDAARTRMYNQGIREGSEAWKAGMDDLSRARTDARLAAEGRGLDEMQGMYGMGMDARQRAIQEQAYMRGLPLSELNQLRTGAQPSLPAFGAAGQMGHVQGPNYMAAAEGQYQSGLDAFNAENAWNANMMNGIFGLARTAIPYIWKV